MSTQPAIQTAQSEFEPRQGTVREEPRRKYLRELPLELARTEPVEPVPPDTRTPAIDKQLEALDRSAATILKQHETEQVKLSEKRKRFEDNLLSSTDEASLKLDGEIRLAAKRIEALDEWHTKNRSEAAQLTSEKNEIASQRATHAEKARISTLINESKQESRALLDAMVVALPRLQQLYQSLQAEEERPGVRHENKTRLAAATFTIEACFSEFVLDKLRAAHHFLRESW